MFLSFKEFVSRKEENATDTGSVANYPQPIGGGCALCNKNSGTGELLRELPYSNTNIKKSNKKKRPCGNCL